MLKKMIMFAAVAGLVFAVPAHAQHYAWTGGASTLEWANAANWNVDGSPATYYPGETTVGGYQMFDNNSMTPPSAPVVVSTNLPYKAFSGHVNLFGSTPEGGAIKIIDGGVIDMHNDVSIGRNGNASTLIMEGGTLTIGGYLAKGGAKGRIEMTGGTINWDSLVMGAENPAAADALINLHGGQFNLNSYNTGATESIQEVIDIQNDGLLVLSGDQTTLVSALANGTETTGLIRGSNGMVPAGLPGGLSPSSEGDLRWAYDGSTYTYVWAVPEPATMAILAFGGLGLVLRRKRR